MSTSDRISNESFIVTMFDEPDQSTSPKSCKDSPNKVVCPDSKYLLVSGARLHKFIQATFDEFKQWYIEKYQDEE